MQINIAEKNLEDIDGSWLEIWWKGSSLTKEILGGPKGKFSESLVVKSFHLTEIKEFENAGTLCPPPNY